MTRLTVTKVVELKGSQTKMLRFWNHVVYLSGSGLKAQERAVGEV